MPRKRSERGKWPLLLSYPVRWLMKLRYRVRVVEHPDLEAYLGGDETGLLFLPCHPAEIDPVIVMTALYPRFRLRPVIVEHFYYLPFFHRIIRATGALPLPSLDRAGNERKVKQVKDVIETVKRATPQGDNFLIYPSGKLRAHAKESLGGASFLHTLLPEIQKPRVVLVRTTGLWGSRFSRALTGNVPDFFKMLKSSWKMLLRNGIFFAPRREVTIELAPPPADFPWHANRLDLNHYLENWYNAPYPNGEPVLRVSNVFWKEELPPLPPPHEETSTEEWVPKPLQDKIMELVVKLAEVPKEQVKPESHLGYDVGLDSLDLAEIAFKVEEETGTAAPHILEAETVGDLFRTPKGGAVKGEEEEEASPFPPEERRPPPRGPFGKTLPEAFLLSCERMKKRPAAWDRLTGMWSYARLKRAACALALEMKKWEKREVGVLLPASVSTYVIILACELAGKIPVMLNWTAGARSLQGALSVVQLDKIITSRMFMGRLEVGDLSPLEGKLVYIEEIRTEMPFTTMLKAALFAHLPPRAILSHFGSDTLKEDETAVLLFTSGTETLPKAVPLTHRNLLSNLRASVASIDLKSDEILYAVLPPFHSFGFTVTGIMPLFTGMRVAYAPDPTNARQMARDCAFVKPTFFCCAPTFVRLLFRAAEIDTLRSIRLYVTGSEKTPQSLFETIDKLGQGYELLEGYGVTECSPIISVNRHGQRKGVGKPVQGVELRIRDEETGMQLPPEKHGEVCIHGPNLFSGYLGGVQTPFIDYDGKRFYRTGDRGYIDTQGNLYLVGRLKRFVKVGGEMIGLDGVESELIRLAKEKKWVQEGVHEPFLALVAKENGDRPELNVFAIVDLDREALNNALREAGFSSLHRIGRVQKVDEIPLTGTGKTHYRKLQEMLQT